MKKREPLITVITSAYNAEKVLFDTAKSVCDQTYRSIEYIIVNHGSNDNTQKIIDELKEMDDRIHTITLKENYGYIGYALNRGIEKAHGDYITFLDSGDKYNLFYLQNMVKAIKKKDYDVAICGYYYVNEKNEIIRNVSLEEELDIKVASDYEKLWKEIEKSSFGYLYVWWNKLYKKSFLEENHIMLPEDTYVHGDAIFNATIFSKFPKINCLTQCFVKWQCILGSTSYGTYKKGYYKEAIESTDIYINLIDNMVVDNTLKKALYKKLVLSICHLRRIEHYKETSQRQMEELKSWIQDPKYQELIRLSDMSLFVEEFWKKFISKL